MGGEGYITKDFFILEFYKSCWQYEIRFIFITLHLTSKITTCISSNSYCHWNQKEVVIHAPTRGATSDDSIVSISRSISIHAPTRGATISDPPFPKKNSISIHAPTRGATGTTNNYYFYQTFQSTLPQGERQTWIFSRFPCTIISIHAPTRGATSKGMYNRGNLDDFNPRSHKGSDGKSESAGVVRGISIHAPTRGATEMLLYNYVMRLISIHAPTRGATFCYPVYEIWLSISIHAPTRGATAISHKKNLFIQ